MGHTLPDKTRSLCLLLLAVGLLFFAACSNTRYLAPNQALLRSNRVTLIAEHSMAAKGEVKDNLNHLVVQKPNSRFLNVPVKLMLYTRHHNRLSARPADQLPKSVERPVIADTGLMKRSSQNMKNYLFSQGYFYARVKDTVRFRRKKAFAAYTVHAGINYTISKVTYHFEDSAIAGIVRAEEDNSVLKKGAGFRFALLEEERSRITSLVRNNGYYRFTQENVNFLNGIDTVDKAQFKKAETPFEGAVNFALSAKKRKTPTVDLDVYVQRSDDSAAFTPYTISSVRVYPDYAGPSDVTDTTMIKKTEDSVVFRYHNNYVHPHVLYEHIYLEPGNTYSQADYDKTIAKLTELGIFQYVRVVPYENLGMKGRLDYDIFLKRSKKHDYLTNYEVSSGSTYFLGNSLTISFRDRNLLKGANLLSLGVNGGVETSYNENQGKTPLEHFSILTRYYGVNASIDFPKFLAPVASSLFNNSNLPHTIIGGGENVIDRINYFTLLNTSANFSYNWRQTGSITWTLSPAFVNIIKVPKKSASFDSLLAKNEYLRNSYKENFIEGENITFTYDDIVKKRGINYSYLKLGLEEAGGIVGFANKVYTSVNDVYRLQFAQYVKFDFDARHYFTFAHAVLAMRFYGGIGLPYGESAALPYIKQYFAGGPYSLRGWRIRTLGPGNFYDIRNISQSNQIDRTGDIKLEYNAEYRFPIAPLFAGAVKMNGALFLDAGNIWLARADTSFPGGNFTFATLGQDIASDVGGGLRFDIAQFLTLRVDVSMPVKKPYVHANSGWVFNEIAPYSSSWRANNIIFNISIGYPF